MPYNSPKPQQLPLNYEFFGPMCRGIKTFTIRKGHLGIKPGPLTFVCGARAAASVEVKQVDHSKTYGTLDESDAEKEGVDLPTLKAGLAKFYPDIQDKDPITIIEFCFVKELPPNKSPWR